MNELVAALRIALGNVFVMYFKAHVYHWNVEGPNFNDYHGYFATVYEDVYDSIDPIAENIRKAGEYAPFSLDNLYSTKTAQEDLAVQSNYTTMFNNLIAVNDDVIAALMKVNEIAARSGEPGLAQFTAERIDAHKKHAWQLKSLAKTHTGT